MFWGWAGTNGLQVFAASGFELVMQDFFLRRKKKTMARTKRYCCQGQMVGLWLASCLSIPWRAGFLIPLLTGLLCRKKQDFTDSNFFSFLNFPKLSLRNIKLLHIVFLADMHIPLTDLSVLLHQFPVTRLTHFCFTYDTQSKSFLHFNNFVINLKLHSFLFTTYLHPLFQSFSHISCSFRHSSLPPCHYTMSSVAWIYGEALCHKVVFSIYTLSIISALNNSLIHQNITDTVLR